MTAQGRASRLLGPGPGGVDGVAVTANDWLAYYMVIL
jgi:hypothetical protein